MGEEGEVGSKGGGDGEATRRSWKERKCLRWMKKKN